MTTKTSSVAVSVLLPLILALSFECLLGSPTQSSNQQHCANHAPPKPQYQNSAQPPAPPGSPQMQQPQRPPINRLFPTQPGLSFAADGPDQQPASSLRSGNEAQQASRSLSDVNSSARQHSGQIGAERRDFAQRTLGKLNSNDVRSMSLDGVNGSNRQMAAKMGSGSNKNANGNSFSRSDSSDNSRAEVDVARQNSSGPEGNDAPRKEKATLEQKELKRKLIELADKATSTPVDLMRFNGATKTFEPLDHDPQANIYRRKLLDAMKALSSRRLPAERLRRALEDDPDERGREFDGSDFGSDSSSESGSEDGDSMSHQFLHADSSGPYVRSSGQSYSVDGSDDGESMSRPFLRTDPSGPYATPTRPSYSVDGSDDRDSRQFLHADSSGPYVATSGLSHAVGDSDDSASMSRPFLHADSSGSYETSRQPIYSVDADSSGPYAASSGPSHTFGGSEDGDSRPFLHADSSGPSASQLGRTVQDGPSDEELPASPHVSYHPDPDEPYERSYEQTSPEHDYEQQQQQQQPAELYEESFVPSADYRPESNHQSSPDFRYVDRQAKEEDERDVAASSNGQPAPESVEMSSEISTDETLDEVREILADRLGRLTDLLYFRPEVLNQLLRLDDNRLTPTEREFKRMVLCNSDERFCNRNLSYCPVGPTEFSTAPPTDEGFAANNRRQANRNDRDEASAGLPEERLIHETGHDERKVLVEVENQVREARARAARAREAADEERRNLLGQAARNLEGRSFEQHPMSYAGHSSRADTLPFLQPQTYAASSSGGANMPSSSSYRRSQSKAFYAYRQAHETSLPVAPQSPARQVPEDGPKVHWAQSGLVNARPSAAVSSAHGAPSQRDPRNNESKQQHQPNRDNFHEPQRYVTSNPSRPFHLPRPLTRPALRSPPLGGNQAVNTNKVQPLLRPVVSLGGPPAPPAQQPVQPSSQQLDNRAQQQMPAASQQPVRGPQAQNQQPQLNSSRNNLRPPVELQRVQSPPIEPARAQGQPIEPSLVQLHRMPAPNGLQPFDAANKPVQAQPVSVNLNAHQRN